MSKARDLADLAKNANDRLDTVATSDGALSNRNMIINGAMAINQRYGSSTATNTSGYQLDRWYVGNPGTNQVTRYYSSVLGGISYMDVTTSSNWGTFQRIENQNVRHLKEGDKLTISAYLNVQSCYFDLSTSGDFVSLEGVIIEDTGVGWYRMSATHTISGQHVVDIRNGGVLQISIEPRVGSFNLTMVQAEVGDTATPFEHRSYGDELARCQRYYTNNFGTTSPSTVRAGNAPDNRCTIATRYNNGELQTAPISFPTTMRVTPSISYFEPNFIGTTGRWGVYGPTDGWGGGIGIGGQNITPDCLVVMMSGAAGVSDFQSFIVSGYFEADAEL